MSNKRSVAVSISRVVLMRTALILGLLLACRPLHAATVVLKSGITLEATRAREIAGEQIEYEIGGTRYTIAKKFVERIDSAQPLSMSVEVQQVKPGMAVKLPSEVESLLMSQTAGAFRSRGQAAGRG